MAEIAISGSVLQHCLRIISGCQAYSFLLWAFKWFYKCIKVLQKAEPIRNIDTDLDIDRVRKRKTEIYFKELAHVTMEVSKSKICRLHWKAGYPGKRGCCSSSPKPFCWQNFLLLREGQFFVLAGLQLIGWGPPSWQRTIHFTQSPLI